VFRLDRTSGEVERLSMGPDGLEGDGDSSRACFSADGRFLAFQSAAANLVSGDTNAAMDVFRLGPLWSADSDGDGIPDDGDLSGSAGDAPCSNGQTIACDDNCRATTNGFQLDADDDGYGNACDCDLDNDGAVSQADFMQFRYSWGTTDALADFNGDGTVNQEDFMILRGRWGTTAPFE
jgi:hypothetical protein